MDTTTRHREDEMTVSKHRIRANGEVDALCFIAMASMDELLQKWSCLQTVWGFSYLMIL